MTQLAAPIPLGDATLTAVAALPNVATPTYPRADVEVGIVHVGVGGFHRAHQAMYIDRLLAKPDTRRWGICGVGVLPADQRMRDALGAQDGLYTLVLMHPDGGRDARVIGSIVDYRYAPDDREGVIELIAAPSTRIVELTITEGGYDATGADADSAFGLITEALHRRMRRGTGSPTVVSCDNIEGNGDVARAAFIAYAHTHRPDLVDWLAEHTRFPNSMVDRITPGTTAAVTAEVTDRFGVLDRWPVIAEPFTAWVLEDSFSAGRPPLERAGVLLVDDVTPYELMKLRLLNAGHQSLCYFGYLAGHRLVHEAADDPLIRAFLARYMDVEATPTLRPVPGIDLADYKRTLLARFANPGVGDTIARLCADSSDRIPTWLLPVIRANLAAGRSVELAAATVASWARYAEAVDEQGRPIDVIDQRATALMARARRQRDQPLAFVEDVELFGDLAAQPRFSAAYRWTLDSLHRDGARATLAALLDRTAT